MLAMGIVARAQTLGKGFSSAYGDFRAGLKRAAEGARCLWYCNVPAAHGQCCLWASTSDQDMGGGSTRGSTTREISAMSLTSTMQTKVKKLLNMDVFF